MEIGTVRRVDIEETMRSAYLSYAMSVITARALPDVRDGLKPVQRRILYAMWDMGIRHDQPTRKSARIVGEVLGKYHPHGNDAVYDAMVRMAQDFAMRYPLVEGQGNFGSVDGDGAAAMRYTEARLSAIGEELLIDIEKNTVNFGDNFDGSLQEPLVLPAKVPNLLVNGVGGIAVGMATNVPPHNLGEIADAVAYLVDHYDKVEDVTLDQLMRYVKGPDFPTGGIILGSEGIRQAYATGKGRIVVRAQAHVEEGRGGQSSIIVTELPYQVNKATLVERIAKLVRDGRVDGIGDLRDESDRTGMRVVVELKRGVEAEPILEHLFKHTQLQATFGANMLALVDGEPRLLPLKASLVHYIEHRNEVLVRRTEHELERARARAHILEGLLVALDNLDEVIQTIRRSRTVDTARTNLRTRFKLTEVQAQAILDMQLRRLAALERKKIQEEYQEVLARIEYLLGLLASKAKILDIVKADILEMKKTYGDPRRTRIADADGSDDFSVEDLLPDEESVLLLTRKGVLRRFSTRAYRSRRAGEHSVPGMTVREGDVVQAVMLANARDSVLFLTDRGKGYNLLVHQIPDVSQQENGVELAALVPLEQDERPLTIVPLGIEGFLALGTRQGKVKRVQMSDLDTVGSDGVTIMGLTGDDELVWAVPTPGGAELMIISQQGKAIRFAEDDVRAQGLAAGGVRGIHLGEDDAVAGGDLVREGGELMLVTTIGFAKRTPLKEYGAQGRGGQGALTLDSTKLSTSGPVAAATITLPDEQVVFITDNNTMLRVQVNDVPRLGKTSWGRVVTRTRRGAVVQVDDNRVVGMVRIGTPGDSDDGDDSGRGSGGDTPTPADGDGSTATATVPGHFSPLKPATSETEASQPETTRRTPSRRRRTATGQVAAAAEKPAAAAKTPTTRRRRSTAKPAAKTEQLPLDTPAEQKPTTRRRRRTTTSKPSDETAKTSAADEKPASTEAKPGGETSSTAASSRSTNSSRRRRSTTTRKTVRRTRKKSE